ncbi:NACHT and WD repeat domain-containing protein 2 isoform X2 [Cryptotermes secundus]|uniref:NACHT and WD repeat domain-containing protein 2 isoform X2 n=1 Tax=Cryptotermes secundus TaxID=105785 RepID=UPI000CD7AB95|nr:NACHT and WD repeat domain-containing protein 2 isoform X2 [Cryptotermes secundus]
MDDRTVDLIFAGSLESLPPVSSKIVRIFTSSTFTDTTMERNTLMAQCYPKLKDYCREKHGLEFQVVDMRWGVRDEATDDHMTTELCMREIANCQRLSMGPNFVVFLGQKYGYRPIPTYILSSELQMLRDDLANSGSDPVLLDTWYRKDSNAVPPVSVLQPISSILVNFNNKRIPKLQQHDQAVWWDTLGKMQKLLRKAALSLANSGKIDRDTMHNYFMSVTEREVINGVLNVQNTKNHCLAYVRYINNINLQNLKKASLFVDILNRSLDTEACKLLANLRDERLPAKIESTNIQRYTVEWIGREGLDTETHEEYLQHFITHFYKNITKLVDRAMRKEDSSAQGQIVTEILQHLHACNNSVKVFYGREIELERIKKHLLGDCEKPMVLYGEGGCGKTSLLSNSAGLASTEWFQGSKPLNIIRFLGTTPDSSALTPTLVSICQQISYNYMLPFEDIPVDLVPLTAYFKHLLTYASPQQPLLLFLDSVDQLTGAQDANKVSWLPLRLPPYCKLLVSCAAEADNPEVSQDYHLLRRMIDNEELFLEVTDLGEELAMQIIRMWMQTACRDLTNYQWRLVCNAVGQCSLPIFVKLVFAEICRWRSYTKPQDTYLASTVMDSIMLLFERVEKQHGRILVFHALAYITAAKSGLSESELEDLISLDDKVLDDVYQYHLPPVRRIPPLLWTRIRNDLPNYLSEREADGVSVMNWYHRQFRDAARERYFKNMNMAMYFHSSIADYYLGIWGGGNPKPFKYTEIQRHRFNLTDKEGSADRKVPVQPLVFYSKDGKVSRYNLRKFGEMPYHMVRARRFEDLYKHVLFNYKWLHAKLCSCPLQAVLSDFEDACSNIEDREATRELLLVADALRLGGAILGMYPDMLAPQLVSRLLPEIGHNPNVKALLQQCDETGPQHCALLPLYHCLHTPGGPLKYSLEGHQFAVFGFCLTSDLRYIVSISNKFITWDLSTSDLTRDVNPGIEGIMQQLVLSPDNRFAAAYTSNNQIVLLNTLTSEHNILDNPLPQQEPVTGVYLLNTHLFVYGPGHWCRFNMRGQLEETCASPEDPSRGSLLTMEFTALDRYRMLFWNGSLENPSLVLHTANPTLEPFCFHSAMAMTQDKSSIYCCKGEGHYGVSLYRADPESSQWILQRELPRADKDELEVLLQLKLDRDETTLLGTSGNGFVVWELADGGRHPNRAVVLRLPHGVRNISTRALCSNSCMVSAARDYVVAGVRKNLYVWRMASGKLMKVLDAHFGRIIALEPLVIGNWNSVITSSIDRTVKVWNINNIFEQVHVIDRHEVQIDSISLCQSAELAITVTRGCVGVWDMQIGRLAARLADSPLGAIVTHAAITADSKYIVSAESGNILIWNRVTEQVLFKEEQPGVRQITLLDGGQRFLAISRPAESGADVTRINATIVTRTIPDGVRAYSTEYPVRCVPGTPFKPAVVTCDGMNIVLIGADKGSRDAIFVFNARNGSLVNKIPLKQSATKDISMLIAMRHKAHLVAAIDSDKGTILDIRKKNIVRTVPKWSGGCTKDGRYGLYAPSRGGLELLELKRGHSVKTFIPKVAEGVFTVICMFNQTDEYVLYYHSGKKTLRVFRTSDAKMIANFRMQAELSAVESTEDGKNIVLGTVDGCVSVLALADPAKPEMKEYLAGLPSRDEEWKKKTEKLKAHTLFKAAASIAKLSTKFNNSNNNENADDDEHVQPATEEETPREDRDADEEEEL